MGRAQNTGIWGKLSRKGPEELDFSGVGIRKIPGKGNVQYIRSILAGKGPEGWDFVFIFYLLRGEVAILPGSTKPGFWRITWE